MAKRRAKTTARPQSPPAATRAKRPRTKVRRLKRKTQPKRTRGKCFVMMPFADPFDIYYERLYRPAIEAADLEPARADDLFRPSAIVSDLWSMIREAKVLLAEMTTKNANVFYELGLAHAIGKPVILIAETMNDVPFDLRQLRVLLYDKVDPAWGAKLARGLTAAIKETLAAPIEAVPHIFRRKVESRGPRQDATQARLDTLENEIRGLRADPFGDGRRFPPESDPARELIRVDSSPAFERWVRRWNTRGLSPASLQAIVRDSPEFPAREEAERIPDIVKASPRESLFDSATHVEKLILGESGLRTPQSRRDTARTGRRASP